MGKADRARWEGNVKSMAIVAKRNEEITDEDIAFLRENYTSTGGLLPNAYAGGAFYTPSHVAEFIVKALEGISGGFPVNARWLEPSVGSGIFLEHIPADAEVTALELDETSARVTALLYPDANVIVGDALTHDRRNYYDFVIGNPPYGVSIDVAAEDVPDTFVSLSKKKGGRLGGKSECAFIELAVKAAKVGGYIAFVLPLGLNYANYAEKVRTLLYENCWHVGTIGLPGETFALTGTTISTQILIVRKAPAGLPLIEPATKRWGSSRGGNYGDIAEYNGRFLPGQPPTYFAKITDIGYDKDGRGTRDKWGDETAQLDELLEDFMDTLVRENLYPHIPSWHSIKAPSAFMFEHGNGTSDGYHDANRTYTGVLRWNELTLGAGESLICPVTGAEYGTWIDECERWQNDLIAKYYVEVSA